MKTDGILAKYFRISKDDGRFGESQSIEHQRLVVDDYIAGHDDLMRMRSAEFIDDGISGVSFNRPDITTLQKKKKKGEVSCVIVKDAYVKQKTKEFINKS
jgi:hypothetical protein